MADLNVDGAIHRRSGSGQVSLTLAQQPRGMMIMVIVLLLLVVVIAVGATTTTTAAPINNVLALAVLGVFPAGENVN